MHELRRFRVLAAALVLALPATLSACGGNGNNSSAQGAGGTTKINVGIIPILDVAPIYLGIKQGFFKDEGLSLSLQEAQGGAAIVPGVVSGQYQFGFSNVVSLLLAQTQGVPVKVVAAGDNASEDPGKDFGGVVVKGNSTIKRPRDLAGKKVGVNTLNNINTVTTSEMVRMDGGDPSNIQYVELPFPDIVTAVAKGDIDAGQVVEPFLTIAEQSGDRDLGSNLGGVDPGMAVAMYFTSEQYASQHADIVSKFTTAMNKSLDYAQAHPDAAKQILSTYSDIDPKVQSALRLPQWTTTINRASVQKLAELARGDGLLTKEPDLNALLP